MPLIVLMCLAEIVGMASFGTLPALLPTFIEEWSLSNTRAGWLNGIYYAGYLAVVPLAVAATDRRDARGIYLAFALLTAASALAFAVWASGFWTALALRAVAGAGLAGTYMVGLKALTDRIDAGLQSRAVAFYTASFSIGASLSYFLAGTVAEIWDWRVAFALAGVGPAVAAAIILTLRPARPTVRPATRFLDFRPVLRNRPALSYMIAYSAHNWELFGLRSWIVVFLVFSAGLQSDGAAGWLAAPTLAAIINLVGLPASVLGNEVAMRLGRRRVVIAMMLTSAALAPAIGFGADLAYGLVIALLFLYGMTVTWDSGSITAGAVAHAAPAYRGATMAMHSMVGFIGAVLGPLAFGVVLDGAGGGQDRLAWGLAFATLGLGLMIGPLALWLFARRDVG